MGSRWVERGTPKGKERDFRSKSKTERNMETGFKNRRTGVRTDVHIWRSLQMSEEGVWAGWGGGVSGLKNEGDEI